MRNLSWKIMVLLVAATWLPMPHAASPLEVNLAKNTWEVRYKDKPVAVYISAPDQWKPYVQALCTLEGRNLLRDSPADHKHHHALMYGVTVNGIDFWGETPGCGIQKPISAPESQGDVHVPSRLPQASFIQEILWVAQADAPKAKSARDALLVEKRTISVVANEADDEVALRWRSEFALGGKTNQVTLTGPNYHGLGLRFLQELDPVATHWIAGKPVDVSGTRQDTSQGAWGALLFGGPNPATLIVAGHPENARGEPVFFSMKQPFAYLSATQALHQQPLVYRAGDRWTLEYVVLAYSGAKTPEYMAKRAAYWTKRQP